jgi:hypothetical protein
MRQNNNNQLIGNMLNEDHKIIVHNQKPKITNFLLIITNFAILAEKKLRFPLKISNSGFNYSQLKIRRKIHQLDNIISSS